MQTVEKYIKDVIYGANDGIITTFAVVAGASGAALSPSIIIIIGLANLFADGFSMAASNYLGNRSEHILAARDNNAVKHIHQGNEFIPAGITFAAFVSAGFLPIAPFLFLHGMQQNTLAFSVVATALALFIIGSARSIFTRRNVFLSGMEMLMVGGIAAFVAYLTGLFIGMLY